MIKGKVPPSIRLAADHESPLSENMLSLMGAPVSPLGGAWSVKILQLVWALFGLILLNTYTANLAAILTVQPLSHIATSFEGLAALP